MTIELIAGFWTLSGPTGPASPTWVCPFPLRDRIEAARVSGFSGIGFSHRDLMHHIGTEGIDTLAAVLRDSGLKHIELELLLDWWTDGERRLASDAVRRDLLEVAARVGARHIKVVGDRDRSAPWPLDRVVSAFQDLCNDAVAAGSRIALEIQPWSRVYDLDRALEVVGAAAHPAGGVMLDIWHIVRGGIPYESLKRLRADQIIAVELCDAKAEQIGTLWEDTVDRRLLPGEGDFDVPTFIRAVTEAGYSGPYSVEILSTTHRARSLSEQAHESFKATRAQFN